jgi:NADPH:quinone reductase-like Zn-dependent oxidoreductase
VKAFYIAEFGGGSLREDHPEPSPGPGEVVVAVEAAGVGYMDVMVADGRYPLVTEPGFILGSELAGVIVGVGDGVDLAVIGRRVFAMTSTRSFAEFCAVELSSTMPIPDELGSTEAVALGINALVAYEVLRRTSVDEPGDVLVRGAGGGIGLLVTQLAVLQGSRVTAVTSSADRGNRLVELGAGQWVSRDAVRTGAQRYDVIIDTVGGDEMSAFLEMLADNGRYVLCGGVAGAPPADFGSVLLANFHRSPTFSAFSLNSVRQRARRDAAGSVFRSAADKALRPVVAQQFALNDVEDALLLVRTGDSFGKVIITP